VEQQNRDNKRSEPAYSTRVKAGRRRTYFIDVRPTRTDEFYLTITESKKISDTSYEKHKIFIYKEDFNKFLLALTDTVNHIKTELMPGVDFDAFDRREFSENKDYNNSGNSDRSNNENKDNTDHTDHSEEKKEEKMPPRASNTENPPSSLPSSDEDLKW
jgi:hypothetical protein